MGRSLGHEFDSKKVRRLMLEKGWSHGDLGDRCGYDRSQITNILRVGRCHPHTIDVIAQALGVEIKDLLPEEESSVQKLKVMLDSGAKMPTRAHETDAGLDLYSMKAVSIPPCGSVVLDTGTHVCIPKNYVGLLTSKSGLMKKGITSRGTIDSDYRGSIQAVLFNHSHNYVSIEKGQKITQLVIVPCITPAVDVVDSLDETERGSNGFGSTGAF